jgi:hypothetical protein
MVINISFVFNGLKICLKNRQSWEWGGKQGKIPVSENFSP